MKNTDLVSFQFCFYSVAGKAVPYSYSAIIHHIFLHPYLFHLPHFISDQQHWTKELFCLTLVTQTLYSYINPTTVCYRQIGVIWECYVLWNLISMFYASLLSQHCYWVALNVQYHCLWYRKSAYFLKSEIP